MKPSSFCTICTHTCYQELIGLLLSLSLHHPGVTIYCMVDTKTKEEIERMTPQPKLNIVWDIALDKYKWMNRQLMVNAGVWNEFQMTKADVITLALKTSPDTLFLDSDIFILGEIDDVDNSKELGLSPHYIKKSDTDMYGFYNGGMIWTNQKSLADKWKEYTKTSRYHDQAAIEDLARSFSYFEFGENYNFSWWRVQQSEESPKKIRGYLSIHKGEIYYKKKPLKFIHTHLNDKRYGGFNNLMLSMLHHCKKYRELLCVQRMLDNKWTIQIPRQPMAGAWQHANDSFRELCILLKSKNKDVEVELNRDSGHVWLKPKVLLYDRPSNMWFENQCQQSYKLLLGNGSMNVEGVQLKAMGVNASPWIFWPRRPMILEKVLREKGRLAWGQRSNQSVFIGNYENDVQERYRKTNIGWKDIISMFHCTAGFTHKFTQQEYLMKLRESKYGLCLRGFGSKCHREVECMAFGTVPLIAPGVTIESYYDPPRENIHYIRVASPEEAREKMSRITEDEWTKMSLACYEWYQRNVHSDNCWRTMIEYLLYK